MKFFAPLAVLAGVAFAQDLSGVPPCSLPCAMKAGAAAGCGSGDIKCFCKSPSALAAAQECVKGACSADDAVRAVSGAAKLCNSVGVPVQAPGAVKPRSSAAAASGVPAPMPDTKKDAPAPAVSSEANVAVQASTSCTTLPTQPSATAPPAVFTGAAGQVQAAKVLAAVAAVAAIL